MFSSKVVADGAAPHSPEDLPMPRWCKKQEEIPQASKKELGDVGQLLKLYARSMVTSPYGDSAETQPVTPMSIGDALVNKQDHVTTHQSQALPPPNRFGAKMEHSASFSRPRPKMFVAEPEPSPSSSDTDQDACGLDTDAPTKWYAPDLHCPKIVGPPGLFVPAGFGAKMNRQLSSPRSQSYSPEPEPSPARNAFRMKEANLGMPTPPELQLASHFFAVDVPDQLTAKGNVSRWQPECEQAIQETTSKLNPQIQHARGLAAIGCGLSGYATVMIQQVPFKYTQSKLINEINGDGFQGTYDFFYLPANARNHGNRGFGFINFLSAKFAEEFYRKYHGRKFKHHEANLPVAVIPADVQGFEESSACFFSSWQLRKKKRHSVPVFLKPVPAHFQSPSSARAGNMNTMRSA